LNLPQPLIQALQQAKGFDEIAFREVHQSGAQLVSVRFNPQKLAGWQPAFVVEEKVPWTSNGYYLAERPSFTLDPVFHAGAYYVQEASSMFLEEALKQTVDLAKPLKVLDLCAAPGGKSTLLQSVISKESVLVSNEVIKTRVNILAENMTKWGAANVIVTNNDPADFKRLPHYFDVIVVDAPCSGSGLFRRDPDAISEWSENNVALCAQRQQRILADIMSSLKEGGVLIYSTCSYSQPEDEAIADWLADAFDLRSLPLTTAASWGIVETVSANKQAYGYRFYPDKVKGEGFFIAAFKKAEAGVQQAGKMEKTKPKRKTEGLTAKEAEVLKPWLAEPAGFFFIKQHEEVIALPIALEDELKTIQSAFYIKKAGIKMGSIIRNELIPAHELAVSIIISKTIPAVDVDTETALQYLRKADIKIDAGITGWVLLTQQHLPIGWIKIMANRTNNYYPKEWRILNK